MTHIMLDIESLCTRPGCVVLAAAFVRFSDEASTTLNLSIPEQQALGLEIDPQTQAWWTQQPAESWAAATSNAVPLRAALDHFSSWINWASPGEDALIWCHGATFDAPILGEVYRRAELEPPWKFWNIQCTRTLYNLAGVDQRAYSVPPPHVALNDALGQTRAANAALRIVAGNRGLVGAEAVA
jgi:3' exoribonuclease, RNase T-like